MEKSYKKSNFKTAFIFLNKKQKNALSKIYYFMRKADDFIDINKDKVKIEILLEEIKNLFSGKNIKSEFSYLKDIAEEYKIPSNVFIKLLEGVLKDSEKLDIQTRKELEEYMYCVAGTVGVIILKILEYKGKDLEEIAIWTGNALQMTNILRDIKQDFENGKIYIPKEERIIFFKNGEMDFNSYGFRSLFDFEKEKAFFYYQKSNELFLKNKSPKLFVASVMKNIYFELLKQINFELNIKNHKISNYKRLKAVFKSIFETIL